MQTTWFDGAHLRVCKQTANIQPFFQSRPMPKRFLGVKVHWQHSLSMEPPPSELFRVVKIDRTALLFPLATSDAAGHAVDAPDIFFLLHAAKVRSSCEEGPGQSALQSAYHNPKLDVTELKQNRTP